MQDSKTLAKEAQAWSMDPLVECRGFALPCLSMAFSQTLADIQSDFSDRAGSLDDLSLQALNTLRFCGGDLAASFRWHLADLMSGNAVQVSRVGGVPASGPDQTCLMLEDEHYDFTAPDALASAISGVCSSELYGLDKRFEFSSKQQSYRELAFGPRTIGKSVMQAFKTCGLPLTVRQLLLPQLVEYLPANVSAVYRALNRAMIVRGVLPEMRVGTMKNDEANTVSRASWDWIAQHIKPTRIEPVEARTQPLLRHLSALQSGNSPHVSGRDIKAWMESGANLAREIEGVMTSWLESADKVLLNWVAVQFDGIFMRSGLDGAFREVFCRVQWPLLKAVLQDKESLIDDLEHPAQRLLGAWVACADEHGSETGDGQVALGKMRAILSELSAESVPDFKQAWARWQGQADSSTQAPDQEAQECYVEPIRAAIKARRIPSGMEPFLVEHRLSVLSGISARFGESGVEWREAVAVLDKLLITLEPLNWRKDRQSLMAGMPTLLERLRANMGLAGVSAKANERFFGMLAKYHSILLNSAQGRPASPGERQS